MTFKEWIESYQGVEHEFSHLAETILMDENFPHDKEFDAIIEYANKIHELDDLTLNNAIAEYKKYKASKK